MTSRLWGALAAYLVLVAIAVSLLHGTVLYAVLALLGGLALKTLIAEKAGWNRGANKGEASADSEPGSAKKPETEHQS